MLNLVLKSVLALMVMHSHSAMAANTIVKLSKPGASSIKSIGTAPVKKFVPLQLGDIRNDEPELPISSTLKTRMKKRLWMAHKRQSQVGGAKRSNNGGEIRGAAKSKQAIGLTDGNSRVNEDQPDGAFDHPSPFDK